MAISIKCPHCGNVVKRDFSYFSGFEPFCPEILGIDATVYKQRCNKCLKIYEVSVTWIDPEPHGSEDGSESDA